MKSKIIVDSIDLGVNLTNSKMKSLAKTMFERWKTNNVDKTKWLTDRCKLEVVVTIENKNDNENMIKQTIYATIYAELPNDDTIYYKLKWG